MVCGNTYLQYIPTSFNQAIGATTPFFTTMFAFLIIYKKEAAEVVGNAKAAVVAFVSVMIFRNPVTMIGMTGSAATIMGIVWAV